jgi:hypothetical protein
VRTVYKYPLPLRDGPTSIEMPNGALIVDIAAQHGALFLWAEVETALPSNPRTFAVVGTGHEVPEDHVFVRTAHAPPFVWHVYERKEGPF